MVAAMEWMNDKPKNLLVIAVFCAIIGLIGFAGFSVRNRPIAASVGFLAPVAVSAWWGNTRT